MFNIKTAQKDHSELSKLYAEMIFNLNESIVSSFRHTTLIKYTVFHILTKFSKANQVMGRAGLHIPVIFFFRLRRNKSYFHNTAVIYGF